MVAEPVIRRGTPTDWLFPALLPSEWGQVEIVVRPVEQIDPPRGRRVRVKDVLALAQEDTQPTLLALAQEDTQPTLLALAQEDTQPTLLAVVRRGMEVVVEIAAIRGEPGNRPVHTGLEWLNLCQRCTGDED